MINSANKYSVSNIFPPENPVKYIIPKYQREYAWVKENWDELLDDIDEEGDHFIGSIICIYKGIETSKQFTRYEIIDGQQRLATISLLYAAIYKLLKDKDDGTDEELKNEVWNLKLRLIQKSSNTETKIELSSQNNNFPDYKSILKEIGIVQYDDNISNKGNRKIYKAYRHFLTRLIDYTKENLIVLLNKINNVTVVRIEVDSASDAFMLFESLNNRGIPLTAVDLIKNKLLSEVEKKGDSIEDAFSRWKAIIDGLTDDYTIQERFLRQFYNSFKWNNKIKIDGIAKATKTVLIDIYEKLIDRDLDFIFNELEEKVKIYSRFVKYSGDEFEKELIDFENVKAAPGYALLLYLFSKNTNSKTLKQIVTYLVKYFIRRNITDFPNTRNLDQIFIDLIELLSADESKINPEFIASYLFDQERFSSLIQFKEKLNGNMYEANIDATRFVLAAIEERYSRTKERMTDFWQRDKSGKLTWTIEHIFPEGNTIPSSWEKMIANGDKDKAKDIQNRLVHKLGNLTLTGFNQNLSNFDFLKKRDRVDSEGRSIGYKNGLYLNKDLAAKNSWKEEDIEKRTSELINHTIDLFKVENELG